MACSKVKTFAGQTESRVDPSLDDLLETVKFECAFALFSCVMHTQS